MMKNIFIYPNLRKDSARDILQPVCDQLRRDGVRLMLPKQMRVVPPIIEDADYMKTEDAVQFADMAVVLGGDGTMLRLAREAAQNQLPLLGINVGHVGFMTELEPAELPEMEKLFTGEFSLDSRMMLHVAVQRGGRIVYENDALNDIVIAKGTAFRVVRVGISADNEEVTRFNGDGVIAATPTGSTAYGRQRRLAQRPTVCRQAARSLSRARRTSLLFPSVRTHWRQSRSCLRPSAACPSPQPVRAAVRCSSRRTADRVLPCGRMIGSLSPVPTCRRG